MIRTLPNVLWPIGRFETRQLTGTSHLLCYRKHNQTKQFLRKSSTKTIVSSPWKDIEVPTCTLPEYIWSNTHKWADKIAVIPEDDFLDRNRLYSIKENEDLLRTTTECGITGKRYTYEELRLYSKRFAASLLNMGLKPGEVVTLLLPNMPEFPICFLGILDAGLTASAINPLYCAAEIVHQMKDSGSRFLIIHPDLTETALKVKDEFQGKIQLVTLNNFDGKSREIPSGFRPFSDFIKSGIDIAELAKNAHPVDVTETTAILPYSSGTTGLPKGVCLTHQNLAVNLAQINCKDITVVEETTKNHQDTAIGVLPFFHIYGTQVVMTRSLSTGSKIVILPRFEPKSFLSVLEKNKDIVLYAVPPIVLFLASHPSVTPKHLENLRVTCSGGAPCGSTDLDRLLEKREHHVLQAYGMTESAPVLTHSLISIKDRATIGPNVPNTLLKIVDTADPTKELPLGETGELCFKGPQIMKKYHNRPEATAETISKDGWLHTGDIGYVNSKGESYILDRKKELIKVKGFQVPPAELEAILREHPKLSDAGVTAIPCQRAGELPVAFVVGKPGQAPPDLKEVQKFVAERVAPYKQLAHVILIDAIPKNPSGKILRRQLKEMIKSGIPQQ